jgi:SAM-dependent methyltransferase
MATTRSPERIAAQYAIERALADRLRAASRTERRTLYTSVYDELFAQVTDHPLLTKRATPAERSRQVTRQLGILAKYLHPESTFLEVGAGDAALSLAVARIARAAIAVDVVRIVPDNVTWPENFRFHISSATDLGVADSSVSLAFSNQLLEHLHPDDALDHLRNVAAALVENGVYVCVTPNRLSGPHDISRDFDPVATGLHLREYSGTELERMFMAAGFTRFEWHAGVRGHFRRIPMPIVRATEAAVAGAPLRLRQPVARHIPVRKLLGGIVVARR